MDSIDKGEFVKLSGSTLEQFKQSKDFIQTVANIRDKSMNQMMEGSISPEEHQNGKENQNKEQLINCHKCNKSLAKSSHLINIAGQSYKWHPECFKCNVCHEPMDKANTCYIYKDKIVCRKDYFKLQQDNSIKCSRCRWPIGASDWIRRAGDYVYHLACFSCDICLRQLSTGEQFTVNIQDRNVRLLCRLHFAIEPTASAQAAVDSTPSTNIDKSNGEIGDLFEFNNGNNYRSDNNHKFPSHQHQQQQQQYLHLLASTSQSAILLDNSCRKELQIQTNLNSMDDLNQEECQIQQRLVANSGGGAPSTSSSSAGSSNLPSSKSKRVRTTFTEDQLSILQTHFQIDSNPDGQDLERIATITGLSKRVTQVWFQNSRARQKKYLIKRKPPSSSASVAAAAASSASGIGLTHNSQTAGNHQFNLMGNNNDVRSSSDGPNNQESDYQLKWQTDIVESDSSIMNMDDDSSSSSSSSSSSTSTDADQLIVSVGDEEDSNSNRSARIKSF